MDWAGLILGEELFAPDRQPNGERLQCGNRAKMMKNR